jgi:hypothetical protein
MPVLAARMAALPRPPWWVHTSVQPSGAAPGRNGRPPEPANVAQPSLLPHSRAGRRCWSFLSKRKQQRLQKLQRINLTKQGARDQLTAPLVLQEHSAALLDC